MIVFRGVDASSTLEEREKILKEGVVDHPLARVSLSTCDRVEVYEGEGLPEPVVLEHLFRVVSGLESPLLGENQIQSQVKRAYEEARLAGPLSGGLHKMFQAALRVGKRVRTETRLSRGAVGHAQIVAGLLAAGTTPIDQLRVVAVGVNKQILGILRFLHDRGNRSFHLVNRTFAKAEAVCREWGSGTPVALQRLSSLLQGQDVLISATSAPGFLVTLQDFPADGPPRIFDLAVPRDVDPQIGSLPGVSLFNVTDLEQKAEKNLKDRASEVTAAESIIQEEVRKFFNRASVVVA